MSSLRIKFNNVCICDRLRLIRPLLLTTGPLSRTAFPATSCGEPEGCVNPPGALATLPALLALGKRGVGPCW